MTNEIDQLKMGDHAAYFFKTNSERLAFVIPYLITGLRNGERCIYITDENCALTVYRCFEDAGIDVEKMRKSGALSVMTKMEAYMRHGVFEPDKMVSDLNNEVKSSLEHGFSGLRASGEMSWALDQPSALARLIEYEEKLQATWPKEFGGLCQYDVSRFQPDLIERIRRIHSVYVQEGCIFRQQAESDFFAQKHADKTEESHQATSSSYRFAS